MINLLPAEWTKLRTTAAFWWTSGLTVLIAAGYGALFAWTARLGTIPYIPVTVIATVALTSIIVMIVQQSMVVTTEYRFGLPATNFRIAPQRWKVAAAKAVLGAVLAAVVCAVALTAALTLADLTAPVSANWPTNPATQRAMWAVPLGMALVSLFVQGIGWIVRNTAGTVVIGMALLLVLESIVGMIPNIGADLVKFMPFGNIIAFMTNQPTPYWDSVWHGFGVFAVWAVAVWGVGVALTAARDA
ncbi:ABC transporter permease [Corynebacterium riegelii]